jgi:hypothetical protein
MVVCNQEPTVGPSINSEDATRLHRIYDTVSKNIERENSLINYRITRAIMLSGGMLVAEGIIINYVAEYYPGDRGWHLMGQTAVVLLSLLGILFCWQAWQGVAAAQQQMNEIKLSYLKHEAQFTKLGFPRPYGLIARRWYMFNAVVFPITLTVLWAIFSGPQIYHLYKIQRYPKELERAFAERGLNKSAAEISKAIKELSGQLNLPQSGKPP